MSSRSLDAHPHHYMRRLLRKSEEYAGYSIPSRALIVRVPRSHQASHFTVAEFVVGGILVGQLVLVLSQPPEELRGTPRAVTWPESDPSIAPVPRVFRRDAG
ncbi:hypothetical protein [Nocardia australiensis]|uniref:hypothetical protein n=1 Tax=Nocardia australiensis TaxID=2887191 RepID=UPI001D15E28A|nr:hypothetical protein [Nocardia australiensis]